MDILLLILLLLTDAMVAFLLLRKPDTAKTEQKLLALKQELVQQQQQMKQDITASVHALGEGNLNALGQLSQMLQASQQQAADAQARQLDASERKMRTQQLQLQETVNTQIRQLQESLAAQMEQFRQNSAEQMKQMELRMKTLETTSETRLEAIRQSMSDNMASMRVENSKKLDEIRGTVDEKLQTTLEKRIAESFKSVSDQLEQVYKGLGEMQNLASDVGGLKKVLSGVKTRGILGEIQLGAILEEILTPEQYDTNVATIPGSKERVEFAVRLPGQDGNIIYLPIDSKFPGDRYIQLQNAQESGDKAAIEAAYKALETVIRSEAKDIRTKYVEPPHTTNFAIMFLPFEGLYAEVVNRGLLEKLQRDYQVNIAGPSTMAALLNSLQMGFRTLAIQKRSNEVWELLSAVKTEFGKFEEVLTKMQGHLTQTSKDLDMLMGTRTRAINRKLRSVQSLEEPKARQILELGDSGDQ